MPGARPVMVNTTGPSALAVRSRATYSALVLPSGSERVRNRKVPLSAVPAITGRTAMRPAARAVLSSRLRPARVLMESPLPVPPFRFRATPRIYRLRSWDPKVADDETPRFPPDATIFRIGGCARPTSCGNAPAAVGAHRAERGIGFGSKLRSPLWASPGFVDTPNRTKSAIGVSHGEEAAAAIVLSGVQGGSDQGGAGEREECQHRGT